MLRITNAPQATRYIYICHPKSIRTQNCNHHGGHLLPSPLQVAISAEKVLVYGRRVSALSSFTPPTVAVLQRSDTERGERKWEIDKALV
jgi:hypothetical protein